jgi:divalent metal cation (Fe/Co/Zn/Cd) transporter
VVVIGKIGWDLLLDCMRVLLDASIDRETLARIREIIDQEQNVATIDWLSGRNVEDLNSLRLE